MFGPTSKRVQRGATSQEIIVRFANQISFVPQTSLNEGTAGLVVKYLRVGSTFDAVSIAPVSLGSLSSSFNSGGIKHIADGYYRLDVPDAAFADGGPSINSVLITAAATGVICGGALIELTAYDPLTNTPQTTPQKY